MELIIITPLHQQTLHAQWLELNTMVGNFVIQEGHAPTVLTLKPHESLIIGFDNDTQEIRTIEQGIAHITRTTVTLLLNESHE